MVLLNMEHIYTNNIMTMTTTGVTRNTVMSFIKHLNDEDFKAARKCVDDDLN